MAEENVKVDLQSSADTTGFEKFEASYNSLAAAKQENIRANGIFSDSERRVRVNLADLVTGLGGAQDGTQALSLAVGHLSEVFELGFAGGFFLGEFSLTGLSFGIELCGTFRFGLLTGLCDSFVASFGFYRRIIFNRKSQTTDIGHIFLSQNTDNIAGRINRANFNLNAIGNGVTGQNLF